jgi:hypothetical protein
MGSCHAEPAYGQNPWPDWLYPPPREDGSHHEKNKAAAMWNTQDAYHVTATVIGHQASASTDDSGQMREEFVSRMERKRALSKGVGGGRIAGNRAI